MPNDYNCPWLKQPITPASGLTPAAVPTIYDLRNTDWISVGGGETKAKPIYGIKPIFINEKPHVELSLISSDALLVKEHFKNLTDKLKHLKITYKLI